MEPDWFGMYKPHSRCVPLLLSLSLPSYLLHAILLGTTGPYVMLLSHAPGI